MRINNLDVDTVELMEIASGEISKFFIKEKGMSKKDIDRLINNGIFGSIDLQVYMNCYENSKTTEQFERETRNMLKDVESEIGCGKDGFFVCKIGRCMKDNLNDSEKFRKILSNSERILRKEESFVAFKVDPRFEREGFIKVGICRRNEENGEDNNILHRYGN